MGQDAMGATAGRAGWAAWQGICSPGNDMSGMVPGGLGCPGFTRLVAGAITRWVLVRANSLRPLEPPEAYKAVPRRVLGLDGQIHSR